MFGLFKKKSLKIYPPMEGEIIDITEVSDAVFSQKMVGDGFAVKPSSGEVKSPVDGKILQIFPTNHAFGIATKEGVEILVHIGLDTVELNGEGFTRILEPGAKVKAGDVVIKVDLSALEKHGKQSVTPVVITNVDKVKEMHVNKGATSENEAATIELV